MYNKLEEKELFLLRDELKKKGKDKIIAWVLWIMLGQFGGHNYYLGEKGKGIAKTSLMLVGIVIYLFTLLNLILTLETNTDVELGVLWSTMGCFLVSGILIFGVSIWSLVEAFSVNNKVDSINKVKEEEIITQIVANRVAQ